MRCMYKVYLVPEEDGSAYTVECDDLPGLVTFGGDVPDAVSMAADALMTVVASMLADGEAIPPATDYPVPDGALDVWVSFETDADYVMGPCVSAAEAARMLGVTPGRVSQMVSAGQLRANRKGGHVWVEEASVRERMEANPGAGRPRRELAEA